MRPTNASCNKCHANIRLFSETLPEKCPTCASLLKYEETGKCASCSTKVALGVKRCEGCRMSEDPTFTGSYPTSSGRGGVNG